MIKLSILFILSFSILAIERSLTLSNEFLSIIVNNQDTNTGRFGIQTTGGNPTRQTDDNQTLLLSRPYPWSSYTTLLLDGTPIILGGPATKRAGQHHPTGVVTQQRQYDDRIETTTVYNRIHITQTLRFVRNPATLVKDLALISYTITNTDTHAHQIGTRVMLDTWLGSNDAAPFRVGELAIQSEKALPGTYSDYWQTFDSLKQPTVIAQGLLRNSPLSIEPPDRMRFVNWGTVADYPWDFDYIPERSFIRSGESEPDTAIALYWDPISVAPGETRTIRTAYGLGGVSLSPGSLSVGLAAPAAHYSTDANPITITAYIQNSGGFDSRNTKATLILPDSLERVSGSLTLDLGTLYVDQTIQRVIKVRPKTNTGTHSIQLQVQSDTLPENEISRSIQIITPDGPTHELRSTHYNTDLGYYRVQLQVTNPTWHPMRAIQYRLAVPDGVELAWFETQDKPILVLPEQQSYTLDWVIKAVSPDVAGTTPAVTLIESYAGQSTPYLHLLPPQVN